MIRVIKKNIRDKNGFTLIELIVVIVILGVLAAVIAPTVTGYIKDSKKKADITNAAVIADAAKRALADDEATVTDSEINVEDLETNGYLEDVPAIQTVKNAVWVVDDTSGSGNNGSIKVSVGEVELYPSPNPEYGESK